MAAINKPHRGLRYYRVFLVMLGFVLLGLNSRTMYGLIESRRYLNPLYLVPESVFHDISAILFVPNVTMILMYLALAIGRPRISNQTYHSALRVLFALALVVGLIYAPATRIYSGFAIEKDLRYFGEIRDTPGKAYSFTKSYFCSRSSGYYTDDNEKFVGCQVDLARDMLYLISAVLVLAELEFGYRVGELGKQKE
ncbi:hypothetical protein BG006_010067 [Podila minutissima]|uniref:Uncharacterized protein n=1 Tax=Podila minutissima TaxID=64525 RepID=A0A9P5SG97_9FUNG|nr:hypothetical protein BG006_010067 [Podila minutissima]